jgi:hypothetical protein
MLLLPIGYRLDGAALLRYVSCYYAQALVIMLSLQFIELALLCATLGF